MGNANTTYRAKRASARLNPTSAATFLQADDATKACVVYFPQISGSSAAFKFRAVGRALNSASHNVTPKVSYGSSITAASNTVIAAATARAVSTTQAVWAIWGDLFWDSTSQVLKGCFSALNGATSVLDAFAVLTNTVSSVDLSSSTAGNALSVEITIATGGGDNGYLDELSLEVL